MSYPNLSLLYYKHYFKDIHWDGSNVEADKIKERNKKIANLPFNPGTATGNGISVVNERFQLETTYPGLLTGSGIPHEAGIEGEFKLGIHFDHTSGIPVIFGSSVKGSLCSVFKMPPLNNDEKKDYSYLRDILPKEKYWEDKEIEELFLDIFEGKEKNDDSTAKNKSIYKRDIFFDAVVIGTKDTEKRILAPDALAPHGDNPLKNPIPIPFLKVRSQVLIEFRFRLHDGRLLKRKDKLELFRRILLDFGAGAKTNVGYGQFNEVT